VFVVAGVSASFTAVCGEFVAFWLLWFACGGVTAVKCGLLACLRGLLCWFKCSCENQ
jgi:hypothetical protein